MSEDKENPKLVGPTVFEWGIPNRNRRLPSAAKYELPTKTQLRCLERRILDFVHKHNKWGTKGEEAAIKSAARRLRSGAWRKSTHDPIKCRALSDTPAPGTERSVNYLDGTFYDPESKCHRRVKVTTDMDLYSRMIVGWKAEFEPFPDSGPKQ